MTDSPILKSLVYTNKSGSYTLACVLPQIIRGVLWVSLVSGVGFWQADTSRVAKEGMMRRTIARCFGLLTVLGVALMLYCLVVWDSRG
jgi:hypothetical protein